MSPFDLLVDAVAFAWILWRQRRVRRVRLRFARRVPILLSVLGLVQFVHYNEGHSMGAAVSVLVIGSCVFGGALTGAVRALTVRLGPYQKGVVQQATWLTVALWVVSLAIHFSLGVVVAALGGPAGATAASVLLYLAVSLGVQNAVVHHRAVAFLMRGEGAATRSGALDVRSWEEPAG